MQRKETNLSVMTLYIVVPCYNEEEVLPLTVQRLLDVAREATEQGLASNVQILLVNDGSQDRTWQLITEYANRNQHIRGIKLAHNVGHQNALWAGLTYAASRCDAAISIDADLQDDPRAILQMLTKYKAGADVVFGVRAGRKTDSLFKRTSAHTFYRVMQKLGCNVVYNHADFRLLSRRALESLMRYPERNLFLRGMVAQMGFCTATVYYDRSERAAGSSKYPLFKMLAFAADGITSFSIRPLRYILLLGLFFLLISLCAIGYGLFSWLRGDTISGWTTLFVSLWFIGGAILVACAIIGEYVGKIYIEVKRRPRFLVDAIEPTAPTEEANKEAQDSFSQGENEHLSKRS